MPASVVTTPTLELIERLQAINSLRAKKNSDPSLRSLEQEFASAECRLASYGTLRPGECNYHIVEEVQGFWTDGSVPGTVVTEFGYPVYRWDEQAADVAVRILNSDMLPEHWARIDDFEGDNYRRILVPVRLDSGEIQVCNIYAKS